MNVNVNLRRLSPVWIRKFQSEKDGFINYFDVIDVTAFEPRCPFCGNHFVNANCLCKEYVTASKKICQEYSKDPINIRSYVVPTTHKIPVTPEQINMIEADSYSLNISLFDNGSCVSGFGIGDWFISNGTYEDGVLVFYARQKGKNQIYQCSVKCVIDFQDYTEVSFYRNQTQYQPRGTAGRYGNYTIIHKKITVATISYDEFLIKLKEASL